MGAGRLTAKMGSGGWRRWSTPTGTAPPRWATRLRRRCCVASWRVPATAALPCTRAHRLDDLVARSSVGFGRGEVA